MSIQTSGAAINGKEAKQLIDIQWKKFLEETPGLDLATSYHRLGIEIHFKLSAYPSDTPVPKREIEFRIDSEATKNLENEEHFSAISRLETLRNEYLFKLEQINEELDILNPITIADIEVNAGNEPDTLRIENGLPVLVTEKVGGRTVEKEVVVSQSKANQENGFKFGGSR